MARKAPRDNDSHDDESRLTIGIAPTSAVGIPAVGHALEIAVAQMGVRRTLTTLPLVNKPSGFDCPGCAWPETDKIHLAEFCENGAKAVAEEATLRRVEPEFFAANSVSSLANRSGYWLGQQGRLTHPMVKREGSDHYQLITWDDAFDLIADELRTLDDPNQAAFYTSGRTSNEAAFLYQLVARGFGTNNLPDCSNMCHESSGSALNETLGVGKGTVSLDDLYRSDLIFVVGQNPGTNHPRMLAALEEAKDNGARIIGVNPLPEAALANFRNPQKVRGVIGKGTTIADRHLQIRLNGDLALFRALNLLLFQAEDAKPGSVLDRAFIDEHTTGFDDFVADARTTDWAQVEAATGLSRADIEATAADVQAASSVIVCWAMGLTQHVNAVATIREVVNFLLLRGNVGRPGAGVCPVRGHSNVQGDRTMGICERPPESFLDALGTEFGFEPPRQHGYDVVDTIRAMRDGKVKVFMAMGGNFVSASPDTAETEAALRNCQLTVQVSTKLNRSHVVTGATALILPALGRTDRDLQASGAQRVTVEDSMGVVHASAGRLKPPSNQVRSEVAIVTALGQRLRPDLAQWRYLGGNYNLVREHIARVVPGFEDMNARIDTPGGFVLPNAARDRRHFAGPDGRAPFTINDLTLLDVPPGHLLLQTMRSHDQFNTTIYGHDDRYRGIKAGRLVVFVNPDDLAELGIADGQHVDVVASYPDGAQRRAENYRVVAYSTPRGCAAAYYPEANVLVPLDHTAATSNTPAYKSIVVRLEPRN